jgi:alkylhydroperoxidase/carboxymuconolactone decarboxylase family protein YurZ
LHTAVYSGIPTGVEAFNAAAETFARIDATAPSSQV